jgi:HEAT repeat protein
MAEDAGREADPAEKPHALIERAAAVADPESDEYWELIKRLQARTDRAAFDVALTTARAPEPRRRLAGVQVLGQIGYAANRPFLEETLPALLAEAESATDPQLLQAAVSALGHLYDPRTLAAILACADHPSEDVRFSVALALPGTTDPENPDATVIEALIRLSRDPDSDVRDWATFGLGTQLEADTPPIRTALADRLNDPDPDTATEALLGLARRHDRRSLPGILTRLGAGDPDGSGVAAARALGDPDCLPALSELKRAGWGLGQPWSDDLDEAIAACEGHGAR